MSLRRDTPTPGLTPRTVASSRARDSVPFRPRSDLPPGPAHTSNQQRRGDVARGHQGSRRGPAAADSSRSPPPPSDEPQASAAGEPRARFPYNHLFTGARRCGERLGTRTSRPLCRRPLLLFYPCRQGRGTPQHGAGQSRISSTPGAQPSRVSCGARAVRRRAHVRSRPERRGTGTGLRPRRGRWPDVTRRRRCSGAAALAWPPCAIASERELVGRAAVPFAAFLESDVSGPSGLLMLKGREFSHFLSNSVSAGCCSRP
ncbi:uncharacterized protein LOC144304071 isoform X2 [Canis aureus]